MQKKCYSLLFLGKIKKLNNTKSKSNILKNNLAPALHSLYTHTYHPLDKLRALNLIDNERKTYLERFLSCTLSFHLSMVCDTFKYRMRWTNFIVMVRSCFNCFVLLDHCRKALVRVRIVNVVRTFSMRYSWRWMSCDVLVFQRYQPWDKMEVHFLQRTNFNTKNQK